MDWSDWEVGVVVGHAHSLNVHSSWLVVLDETRGIQFTVFTDRSQGRASLKDGQLELVVRDLTCSG